MLGVRPAGVRARCHAGQFPQSHQGLHPLAIDWVTHRPDGSSFSTTSAIPSCSFRIVSWLATVVGSAVLPSSKGEGAGQGWVLRLLKDSSPARGRSALNPAFVHTDVSVPQGAWRARHRPAAS